MRGQVLDNGNGIGRFVKGGGDHDARPESAGALQVADDLHHLYHSWLEVEEERAGGVAGGCIGEPVIFICHRIQESAGLIFRISFVDIKTYGCRMPVYQADPQLAGMTGYVVVFNNAC